MLLAPSVCGLFKCGNLNRKSFCWLMGLMLPAWMRLLTFTLYSLPISRRISVLYFPLVIRPFSGLLLRQPALKGYTLILTRVWNMTLCHWAQSNTSLYAAAGLSQSKTSFYAQGQSRDASTESLAGRRAQDLRYASQSQTSLYGVRQQGTGYRS
jgi:hypothetical protein